MRKLKSKYLIIFQKYPKDEAEKFTRSILNMEGANSLITTNQNLNVLGVIDVQGRSYGAMEKYNKDLLQKTEEIYEDFCPKYTTVK